MAVGGAEPWEEELWEKAWEQAGCGPPTWGDVDAACGGFRVAGLGSRRSAHSFCRDSGFSDSNALQIFPEVEAGGPRHSGSVADPVSSLTRARPIRERNSSRAARDTVCSLDQRCGARHANCPRLATGEQRKFVSMKLVGANPAAALTGADPLPGKSNYLIGNDPHKWHSGVPQFGGVRYAGVYPGIDLIFYGNQGHLEYDFRVAPGADPSQAELQFDGASKLELSGGDLILTGRRRRRIAPASASGLPA